MSGRKKSGKGPDTVHAATTRADPGVAMRREKGRERARRRRALQRQAASIEFVRTDAKLFLYPDRLSQKAGAPKDHLRRMALKELVDNALDAAPTATLTAIDEDTFVVEDEGPGIERGKVVELFSVTRPMMSTKLIRRPTRGMVGNGLRVATGAAFASGGSITVESCGTLQELSFDTTSGETIVAGRAKSNVASGTKITIKFGQALMRDRWTTLWGDLAIRLSGQSAKPLLTHPDWYSAKAFEELIEAARGTARNFANLFGVDICNARCQQIEQGEPTSLKRYIDPDGPVDQLSLDLLRSLAPKQPKLIPIAEDAFIGAYRLERVEADVTGAIVPAIVQAWASTKGQRGEVDVQLIVNRTPTVADLAVYPGGESYIKGCGLTWSSIGIVAKGAYSLTIAVTTPAIALISDGKTPDLLPFRSALIAAIGPVLRRAHRPKNRGTSIKDAAFEVMEEAYLKASARGTLPANARQIMYAARPFILGRTGRPKLDDAYFTQVLLPAFVDENQKLTAAWDVVYDARGHLIEPHTNHSLPLGTLHVREYLQLRQRHSETALISTAAGLYPTVGPGDRYGAVLFIEKEGFEPLLRAARIAERFDIAIMSTKGMSVIAARRLVDRLSASGVKILVAHDLDMAGIRIFGTLGADSSRYQFSHRPDIRRLGLTLEQAEAMELQLERQNLEGDHGRILTGLREHGASDGELAFIAAGQRVELNAMPSDQFIAWIEHGLRDHGVKKVIPSAATVEQRARRVIGLQHLQRDVADLERAARQHAAAVELPADLAERIRVEFMNDPTLPWEDALRRALDEGSEEAS